MIMSHSRSRDRFDMEPIIIDVRPEPKTNHPSYTRLQKTGQAAINFFESVTPAYFMGQVVPPFPYPINGIPFFAGFAFNSVIGDALFALAHKEKPLADVKALGDQNFLKGMLKMGSTKAIALGTVMGTGYMWMAFASKYSESFRDSDNEHWHRLGKVLTEDAFIMPMAGTLGYMMYKSLYQLGMKLWDACSSKSKNEIKPRPKFHMLQTSGQYLLRFASDMFATETTLYLLNIAGQPELAGDYRMQVTTFMFYDVALQLGKYLSFTLSPLSSLVPEKETQAVLSVEEDDYDEETLVLSEPTGDEIEQAVSRRTLAKLGVLLSAYAVNEIMLSMHGELYKVNTLAHRTARIAMFAGVPIAADYILEEVVPRTFHTIRNHSPQISNFFSSMFSCKKDTPYTALPTDDLEVESRVDLRK